MKTVKALMVDFDLIAQSMRDLARETSDYYLDKNTGKVIGISRALIKYLENPQKRSNEDLPDWDAQMIPLAREIVLKGTLTYIRIPEAFGQPEHKWMVEFAKDLRAPKLRQRIFQAMKGRGSCRRFMEILKEYPDESRRWTMFRVQCWKIKIQPWLESHGILAIDAKPSKPRATAK